MKPQPFVVASALMMAASLTARAQTPGGITSGLVAYFPLDGNANEATGQGINGTLYNVSPTTNRFGLPSGALSFDGASSYVDLGAPAALQFTGDFTVTAWVTFSQGTLNPRIVSYGADCGYELYTDQTSGNRNFGLNLACIKFGGDPTFPPNTWHFVAARREGTNACIFVDGGFLVTNAVVPAPAFSGDLNLGRKSLGGDNFWGGAIDDVRFYSRALSDSEIQQLYAYEETNCIPYCATATAALTNGFVVGATVTDGGYGYTNPPPVRFIGGGGTGANGVAVVSNRVVRAINILNAGLGYTNAPLVVIEPPFIPNPVLSIAPMSFLTVTNLAVGGNYQFQQFTSWYWVNLPLSFTATNNIFTQMVGGVAGSGDYRLALNPVPAQAFATAQVVNGFVVGATVTAGGSGYFTPPAVTINGDAGTNATATASVGGGSVTNIVISSAGIGYTNIVTVQIAPPPAAALPPSVQPMMRLDAASLSPYDNYQIQFKPSIGSTWQNWDGGLFSPTAVTNSQYIFVTNGAGFFRLQYLGTP